MIARMWEVRCRPDTVEALLRWLVDTALPGVRDRAGHVRDDLYRSDERVVVVSVWDGTPVPLPEPPGELVARPPHAWDFTTVDRPGDTA